MPDLSTTDEMLSVEDGTLADALGSRTRFRLVCRLVDADGPVRQYELADALDVSEPSISRSKTILTDAGVVTETAGGLTVPDDVARAFQTLRARVVQSHEVAEE